jgi:hypothetical protein
MVASAAPRVASGPTFNQLAVPYDAPLQNIAYDGGTRSPVPVFMRPDGYISRFNIYVTLSGQYGTAGPTAIDAYANLAGPVDRIEIRNAAISDLYNLTGEMAALFTFLDRWYHISGISSSSLYSVTAAPGTAAFANNWQFDIPLSVIIRDYPTPVGLYPAGFLGPPPVINIYWRPIAATAATPGSGLYVPGGGGTGPNPVGNADISQSGFAPVMAASGQPSGDLVHRFREGNVAANGNQSYEVQLLQGAFYGRIIIFVVSNGALNPIANIARLQFEFGAQSITRDLNAAQLNTYMVRTWGGAGLPNWVFVFDTYTRTQSVRDWINSSAMTQPRFVVTLQNCTFGGTQNMIRWAAEEFAPVQAVVGRA